MTIKFLTVNVWHGGKLMKHLLEFLEEQNPDILVMQEVYNEQNKDLKPHYRTIETVQEKLHYEYVDFAGSYRNNFPDFSAVQGNAVLSRFPISNRSVTFFDRPFDEHFVENRQNVPHISRNLQHVTLDTPGGEVNIFNFHGIWDLAGADPSPARQNMVDVILKATVGQKNVILAGDTNATTDNPAMHRLEPSLRSVFGTELKTTFNMRRKDQPGYATASVDMVYISPNIKVVTKDCPDVDVSDHLPLVTMLKY